MNPDPPGHPAQARRLDTDSASEAPGSLVRNYLVERRLPGITEPGLVMLQAALVEASRRFAARGELVLYVRSTFVPGQHRLLSFFAARSIAQVRAANEAALIPFISIEPVIDLPDPSRSTTE